MQAFHGQDAIKAEYLARVSAHEAADEIIHGSYWERGKGCAVGCTIHSGEHASYETELGIPRILARLEDRIFRGDGERRFQDVPAPLPAPDSGYAWLQHFDGGSQNIFLKGYVYRARAVRRIAIQAKGRGAK